MPADLCKFLTCGFARLVKDQIRNAKLANVVQQTRAADILDQGIGTAEFTCDACSDFGDSRGVIVSPRRFGVDACRKEGRESSVDRSGSPGTAAPGDCRRVCTV